MVQTCPKRRDATKKDIEDDSCAPDIDLRSIVSSQHLGCHVIRTSNNLIKLLTCYSLAKVKVKIHIIFPLILIKCTWFKEDR